jgi:hypothetical protein
VNLGADGRRVLATLRGLPVGRLKVIGAVCFLLALGSWAIASPVGASPDEDVHLVSVWCSHGARPGICESPDATSAVVPAALLSAPCYAYHPEQSAACQRQAPAQPAMVRTTKGNFTGTYPPVFYWVDGFFVGHDVSTSVITMRIANLVLFVGVFVAVYLLLPTGLRRAQIIGTLLTVVPLGMFLIPSINPSGWAILCAATFLVSVLGYLTSEDRRRRVALGVLAALALLIGAGARADAAMYAIIAIAVAVILTARSATTPTRRLAYPAALAVVAALAFLSAGQSSVVNPDASTASHFSAGRLVRDALDLPSLWAGALGAPAPFNNNLPAWAWGLGWLDTAMPAVVWVGAGAVYAAVLFTATAGAGVRRMVAVGLVGLAAFLVPAYVQVLSDSPIGGWVQPRYVLPLLTMLAIVATVRLDGTAFRLTRGQRWIVLAVLAVANAAALFANVRRYVTGTDGKDWNLDRNVEWWWDSPVRPMAVCIVGVVVFGIAITLLTTDLTNTAPARTDPVLESVGGRRTALVHLGHNGRADHDPEPAARTPAQTRQVPDDDRAGSVSADRT